MSIFSRLSVKTVFASFLPSLLSFYHGPTTPPPQAAAMEAPQPPRPQDDIESGGSAATTHNQQSALPSTEEVSPQPVPRPLEGIESDGNTAPTTRSQHNVLPSMEKLAIPAAICTGVYALIPPQELLDSHPLRYSPLLASVCLTVVAAGLSLLWHHIPHYYHRRRLRSIEVAVVSTVFSCLLRILLLIPGKSLLFVAGFFFLAIGFAAIYVLSPPRHLNSSPV